MIFTLGLLLSLVANDGQRPCDIAIGDLVPNAQVARRIAEAVIRGRETPERRARYRLDVEPDGQGDWRASQSLPQSPPNAHGNSVITRGGGGLTMRIGRCDGKISEVHYVR